MAFLTNMPLQTSLSTVSLFAHKSINPQPTNPSIICFREPRNTWSSITTTSQRCKQSLNPYDSFSNHMSRIIADQDDNHGKPVELVKQIRRLIVEANEDTIEDLILVDALQRLAIDHHFENEINLILTRRYMQVNDTNLFEHQNLYNISLRFRILRQNGFHVSADVFMKFKGNDDKFKGKPNNDIRGLMALYEASHLRVEGEMILDEAAKFSCQILQDEIKFLGDEQVKMVIHTLENPYQKTLPLFNLKNSIKEFKGTVLQELAEMDFNMMQSIHQQELDQISRWWRELGLGQELVMARDQPLKWYLWPMAALTRPNLSMHRILLTKTISLIYFIDDIFDVYGNIHELTLFTQAINRWDPNGIEELPYYMRSSFTAVYNITNEIANKVFDEHGFNPITSLWKSWATLCNAFLVEAKWFACGHIPMAEEYLKNGMISSGVQVLLVHMFYLLGNNGTTKINHDHAIISSVSKILRLWDDLGTAQDENQDGHDGSYIKCFLNENEGCSIKIAREHVSKLISETWESLNKGCLSPNPYSPTFIKACNNIVRMVPLMYSYGDNGSLPLLNFYIKAMLHDNY